MTDLHTRLVAAVTARRELAQAATPWPSDVGIAVTGPPPAFVAPDRVVAHMQFNAPAQVLRDTEAHLKILDDHKPLRVTYWPTVMCTRCSDREAEAIEDPMGSALPWIPNESWPCPTVAALAGIYPEVTEQ